MPIRIEKVEAEQFEKVHIRPFEMLLHPDRIFRQYSHKKPQEVYYIHCGIGESNLVVIWYDDEDEKFRMSTEDEKGLKRLLKHVTVVDVTDEIEIFVALGTYDS